MTPTAGPHSPRRKVLLVATLVLVLAFSLWVRRLGRSDPSEIPWEPDVTVGLVEERHAPPPPGAPPEPAEIVLADLPAAEGCWPCLRQDGPLGYRIDLDRLAPLGTGSENAALWLAQFSQLGPRWREAIRVGTRPAVELGAPIRVLAPDSSLLEEAAPWMDQATCRFYPEVWPIDGWNTPVPDIGFVRLLASSWIDRGLATDDPDQARQDLRRALRLGRLLLQDDLTAIQTLTGHGILRAGLAGLYEVARRDDRPAEALAATIALVDNQAIRYRFAAADTRAALRSSVRDRLLGWRLEPAPRELAEILRVARDAPTRSMRAEAVLSLHALRLHGDRATRRQATQTLQALAEDPDPAIAELSRSALETEISSGRVERLVAVSG